MVFDELLQLSILWLNEFENTNYHDCFLRKPMSESLSTTPTSQPTVLPSKQTLTINTTSTNAVLNLRH